MVWGNPPAANKPPPSGSTLSTFMPTEQFPSLGAAPPSGRPSGSGSATQPPAAAPSKQVEQLSLAGVPAQGAELGYHVTGSKKGGFPVAVEKRSCGKKVTVIRNVVGDRSALLSGLKKKLGCGGVVNNDGSVEVQGERQPAVEKYLTEKNCLKAVSKAKKVAAAPVKAVKLAELTKIDKKMAEARSPSEGKKVAELSSISELAAKKMKPTEIKVHLKAAGLSIQGNKKELLARLLEQIK